jgi:endonuclease/exonuclease/phosphatase family metal-dependent hydrolase/uncharacterized cupredoxin-like copper-binding protein
VSAEAQAADDGIDPVASSSPIALTSLTPGRYRLTLTDMAPDVDVTGISCAPQSAVRSLDVALGWTEIEVGDGESVECTATTVQRGAVVVRHEGLPATATQPFVYTGSWGDPVRLRPGKQVTSPPLEPGTYAVDHDVPPGWETQSASCDDGSDPSAITVDPGETVTCTFSTAKLGTVTVSTKSAPKGSGQAVTVDPSWGKAFDVADGQSRQSRLLSPGSYSLDASAEKGWDVTALRCAGTDKPSAIDLEPGEDVSCLAVVTQRGQIEVRTAIDPADAQPQSAFTPSWGDTFTLAGANAQRSRWLAPGKYAVTLDVPDGWVRTEATCDDGSKPKGVRLNPGELVTCTFGIAEQGRIVLAAQIPAAGGKTVTFTPSWDEPVVVTSGESTQSSPLDPGTYSVDAAGPDGWSAASATCDDGSEPTAVVLDPGETVTCTFAYAQPRFTVASFNVLGASHSDNGGHAARFASGTTRMSWTVGLIQRLGIDVIGMQEFQPPQAATFNRQTGNAFSYYPSSSPNVVAWRTSVFDRVDARPNLTPYINGRRVPMPAVRLRHKATGVDVWVVSAHNAASLARTGNNDRWRAAAREQQVGLTRQLRAGGTPVIMTGDMNEREPYFCRYTASGDMRAAAGGSTGGRCQPPPASLARIDWVFGSRDIAFSGYRAFKDGVVNRTSDHPLIVVDAAVTG